MNKIFLANSEENRELNKKMTIVALAAALAVFAILLYKAVFSAVSFGGIETFYLTVPHRVDLGDSLLIDEWHTSQFSSFIQYPFIFLYTKIFGTTDGIVFFMRLVFIAIQIPVGMLLYSEIKKKSYFAGIAAMLMFCLYIPEAFLQLNYFTQGIICAELIALLVLTTDKREFWRCFLVGVLTAVAITSQPFNAVAYALYTVTVVCYCVIKKFKKNFNNADKFLAPKYWVYMTIGAFVTFCIFLVYLLKDSSLSETIAAIPNLFKDSQHDLTSVGSGNGLFNYGAIFAALFDFNKIMFPLCLVSLLALTVDRKRQAHLKFWFLACGTVFVAYSISLNFAAQDAVASRFFNNFPFFIFGLETYILTRERNKNLLIWWLFGVAYTLCLGSSELFFCGSVGCTVSNTAGVLMLVDLLRQIYEDEKKESAVKHSGKKKSKKAKKNKPKNRFSQIAAVLFVAATVLGVFINIAVNTGMAIRENRFMEKFNGFEESEYAKVDFGPLSHIYMEKSRITEYENMMQDIDKIKSENAGEVLVTELIPWCYLYINRPYPTFSAWDPLFEWDLYEQYFESTSDYPEVVYVPYRDFHYGENSDISSSAIEYFTSSFDCTVEDGKGGYILTLN